MTDSARQALAQRLRQLREEHWADVKVTQRTLARALGVSEALVSSWENLRDPVIPPAERLSAYATYFARKEPAGSNDLGGPEREVRDALLAELKALRLAASPSPQPITERSIALGGTWHFADGMPIRIVCSEVPRDQWHTEATPTHPTLVYGKLYAFSNIDALLELHGHIRAANPQCDVRVIKESELGPDDYVAHLVVLGGVDTNRLTRRLQDDPLLKIPVRQISTGDDPAEAYFEVVNGDTTTHHGPALSEDHQLNSDVGHFLRMPNPFNRKRTLTICNGMYSLGVYGVVRALTDTRFRDRNEDYLNRRFANHETVSVLMRVSVLYGTEAITPDWTDQQLHEWSA